jgi:hypothetical protein
MVSSKFSEFFQEPSVADSSLANTLIGTLDGAEKRRGSRLMLEIPITVMGMDTLGEPFKEAAITTSISCYGCKYRTRRYAPKDSVVTLEIRPPSMPKASRIAHARVIWVQRPRHHRETFQIGLELETPGNVWGIDSPPPDWFPAPGEVVPPVEEPEPAPPIALVGVAAAPPDDATKVEPAGEWETLRLPEGEQHIITARVTPDAGLHTASARDLVSEAVRMTTDAMIAEEIALVRKHFTGRLESALLETLKSFSELTAEIVNGTREACRASAREMEAEFQRIAREASPLGEASTRKAALTKRRKKHSIEP